jgi:hypothetical protein
MERYMPTAEHVECLIFQLFKRKLRRAGDEISGEELAQSRGFLPDGVTSADIQRGMEALIDKGYFLYYTHAYRHFFQLTPDGMQAVQTQPLRRLASSDEQHAASQNGRDHSHNEEPDRAVTRGASEEFRQAGAQRGRGLHANNDQHHTHNEQGNPDNRSHPSLLLRAASIMGKATRRLLRIVPSTVIELRG